MKLTAIHLFLILLFVLVLGGCCFHQNGFYEGYTNASNSNGEENNRGIKKSDIPPGDEDLYVLKSSIVPQSFPSGAGGAGGASGETNYAGGAGGASGETNYAGVAGGASSVNGGGAGAAGGFANGVGGVNGGVGGAGGRDKPCPACPPCGRCPEPAFECKKVPSYTSNNDRYLPKAVLSDFSTFGS